MSTDTQEADVGNPAPVKQDISHNRSDSALSMDSFVRIHDVACGFNDVTSPVNCKQPLQETIDRSPAIHPSFQSLLHAHNTGVGSDSDTVGDGSIIFTVDNINTTPAKESQAVMTSRPSSSLPASPWRDRFPSFDSAGSSGSVVRKATASVSSKPQAIGPQHPVHPKILPYHERRKLMQQRQQQQQPQQQQVNQLTSRGPQPPRSAKVQPKQLDAIPPAHPSNQSQAPQTRQAFDPFVSSHFASLGGDLEHENPLLLAAVGMSSTMPAATAHTPEDQTSSHLFPKQSREPTQRPEGFRNNSSQASLSFPHDSNVLFHASWEMDEPRSFLRQTKPDFLTYHVSGDVIGSQVHNAPVNQWYTSASFDSLTDLERTNEPGDPRGALESSESEALPSEAAKRSVEPPPPPPPNPTTHVYRDSVGSFSSLGSLDRSAANRGDKSFLPNMWVPCNTRKPVGNDFLHRGAYVDEYLSKFDQRDLKESREFRQITARPHANSSNHPPTSRGGHRRLNSIENDDWSESNNDSDARRDSSSRRAMWFNVDQLAKAKEIRGAKLHCDDDERYTGTSRTFQSGSIDEKSTERMSHLPPSGISSNEYADIDRNYSGQSYTPFGAIPTIASSHGKSVYEKSLPTWHDVQGPRRVEKAKKTSKKSKRRSGRRNRYFLSDESSESPPYSSTLQSHRGQKRPNSETRMLLGQQRRRDRKLRHYKHRYIDEKLSIIPSERIHGRLTQKLFNFLIWTESFVANLPLSIGGIALSIANLGVVWFKFAEVNLSSCTPVHFHSSQCSFPEFPGCFYCDTTDRLYRIAEYFHFSCSCFAGILALSFIAKLILAQRVVADELSSPTTASPAGFICMTLDIVFAGRGVIGELVVCSSAFVHLCLAVWFLYLAMAYHMLPEPSWFPATTGLGIPAIKVWLYFPMAGHFILSVALSLMFVFFPISIVRVFLNHKISATIGWMQMSAPDVALYAVTIMAQPSFQEENPDINHFQRLHRQFYLPFMTFLFALCLLGAFASVYSLFVRWNEHSKLPFSHAHAAFCAPALSHANAVQAYRSAVQTFSGLPSTSGILYFLYAYWIVTLIGGTCLTVCIAIKYLLSLPKWTHFDIENDIEPPAPYETAMSLASMVTSGDALVQPFVSPPILQANEAGSLVFTRDAQGLVKYVRTRKVTALGFEPIMDSIEVDLEREFLLDWVTRNAPRRRNRTLSVPPGIDFNHGASFGSDNVGVYGAMEDRSNRSFPSRRRQEKASSQRQRAFTSSPQVRKKQDEGDVG